jgi:hypothetical protein
MPGLLARLLQIPADEIETELESLRQQKLDIDRQVKVLESLLELPRTVGTVAVGSHSNEEPANDQARSAGDTVPFLREGIMAVLETDPNRPWKLAEIFGEMVKRSWLSDNDSGRNRLQLRVADMAAKGELTKPGYGYYQLPPVLSQYLSEQLSQDPLVQPFVELAPFSLPDVPDHTGQVIPYGATRGDQ